MSKEKLVEVRNLKTYFQIGNQTAKAVDGLDFDIYKGEVLGIVGESGSGKSVTSLSLIQLIPNPPGEVAEGKIRFKGETLFDGNELKAVKAVPQYLYFNGLTGARRHIIAALFLVLWFSIHSMLPLAGFIPHATSIALALTVMITLFYESPRAKAMEDFREKLYRRIREIRGREIAMIFQEPMTSLNPVYTVGLQIIEALKPKSVFDFLRDAVISGANSIRTSTFASKLRVVALFGGVILFFSQLFQGWTFQSSAMVSAFATGALIPGVFWGSVLLLDRLIPKAYHQQYETLFAEGVQLLRAVGISDPEKRMRDYPHQFSGGMRQRAMIAMALAKHPSLLIADEPTTALDVTIQAQILELMLEIKNKQNDSAVVLITHDLAVVAETCERVMVMYGGKIQEVAAVNTLFEAPKHPYTKGLLHSIPRPTQEKRERLETIRGMVPSILNFPAGCKFCTRCDEKLEKCETIEPDLLEVEPGHFVRCHLFSEVKS